MVALLLVTSFGCTGEAVPFSATFAAADVASVTVISNGGPARWVSADTEDVHVAGALIGAADDLGTWSAELSGDALTVIVDPKGFARSDLVITGPATMDLTIEAIAQDLVIDGLIGALNASGGLVSGAGLEVSGELAADYGADLDLTPTGALTIDVGGDSSLGMPYGLDYTLSISCAEGASYEMADLGFEDEQATGTRFAGTIGDGSLPVTVTVDDGALTVEAYDPGLSLTTPPATR